MPPPWLDDVLSQVGFSSVCVKAGPHETCAAGTSFHSFFCWHKNHDELECIPVGCVPAACRPYARVCFPGGCLVWGVVCLVKGGWCVWSGGVPGPVGSGLGGCVSGLGGTCVSGLGVCVWSGGGLPQYLVGYHHPPP